MAVATNIIGFRDFENVLERETDHPADIAVIATLRTADLIGQLLDDETAFRIGSFDGLADIVQATAKRRFHVILIDMGLGLQKALQILRTLKERLPDTPSILLAKNYSLEIEQLALQAGAYDCVDIRDLAGPIFRRSLRYVRAHHAADQELRFRTERLDSALEVIDRGEDTKSEFVRQISGEIIAPLQAIIAASASPDIEHPSDISNSRLKSEVDSMKHEAARVLKFLETLTDPCVRNNL